MLLFLRGNSHNARGSVWTFSVEGFEILRTWREPCNSRAMFAESCQLTHLHPMRGRRYQLNNYGPGGRVSFAKASQLCELHSVPLQCAWQP